jgi:D-xylulose kinase
VTLYLGLDVGTQGTKGLVIEPAHDPAARGTIVARASRAYGLIEGLAPGAAEQHPDTWLDAARGVVADLERHTDLARLAGIGVAGQQHGCVLIDADGRCVRPAKLWCDTETADEARELSQRFGSNVPTGYTASKVLWLARHEPASLERAGAVLLPHDYVNFVLTGALTAEAGDASGTGWFDVARRDWDTARAAAIDARLPQLLPELVAAGAPAGELTGAGAARLGLPERLAGIPVAPGGGDNMLSAIGAGATRPGVSVLSLGTSATVFTYSATPVIDPQGLIAPFCDSTGGWLPLLCVMNATGVLAEVCTAFASDLATLTHAAADVPPGCDGLVLLPYLSGERVPDLPHATGQLQGLRPGLLRPGHVFRAALEGVALNLALGVERMRALGLAFDELRLAGGGAQNALWRQILADALAAPVRLLAESESAALGAALQALWTARRLAGEAVTADAVATPWGELVGVACEPDAGRVALYRAARASFAAQVERSYR